METEVVMVYPWHFTDHARCIKNNWFKLKTKWLRQVLCVFSVHFNRISIFTLYNNCVHLSVICILINLLHLFVLTRKPLRSSPIYIILTTIAILDIISLSYDVHMEIAEFYKVMKVCYPKETDYNILLIKNIMEFIRNYTRRCSTWHSFSIALIRTLIIKNPINPKFEILSKPKIAFYVIPTILILCAPIHLMDIYKYEIEIYDEHYKCTQYPEYTTYFYGNTVSAMFQKDDNRIQKINRTIDAIISKFIPCLLFPIVTIILVIEIRKADIQKQRMAKSSNESKKASIESRNTSRLVLFLTLPFFMAELPLGIIFMISPMDIFRKAIGFTLFMEGLEKFFSFILSGTTATHMIVCLFMSAQYRKIVWSFVRCGYTVTEKKSEMVVQVHSQKMLSARTV